MIKLSKSRLQNISNQWSDIILATGFIFFLIVITIPLLIIGHYNFPSLDDYSYAFEAGYTYGIDNGGLANIWTLVDNVIAEWHNWQGTYFANYWAYLCNALFMEDYYFITPYITLLPMIAAEMYAGITILRKGFGASRALSLTTITPIICLQILYTYCPCEAYYWMCGATLYTTAYTLSLLTIGIAVSILFDEGKKCTYLKKTIFLCLSFAIGGSNYISGLLTIGILFCIATYSLYTQRPHRMLLTVQLILTIAFMLLSIFSPGAANRQNVAGDTLPPWNAILRSFVEAYDYIKYWSILPVILLTLALIPAFVKVIRGRSYSFPTPILFTLLTFCIYAMEFTPCLYALGIIGANRIQNIYRHTLYILLPLNAFYWTGYFCRTKPLKKWTFRRTIPFLGPLYAGLATLILLPTVYYYGGNTVTTVSAIRSLRTGIAQQYLAQYEARMEILTDESITDAVLEPLYDMPYLLFFHDIQVDSSSWENYAVSRYFRKNSVSLSSEQ